MNLTTAEQTAVAALREATVTATQKLSAETDLFEAVRVVKQKAAAG